MSNEIMLTNVSKKEIGEQLKSLVTNTYNISAIETWASDLEMSLFEDLSSELNEILYALIFIEEGPEFEYTQKQLQLLAEMLIDEEDNTWDKFNKIIRIPISNREIGNIFKNLLEDKESEKEIASWSRSILHFLREEQRTELQSILYYLSEKLYTKNELFSLSQMLINGEKDILNKVPLENKISYSKQETGDRLKALLEKKYSLDKISQWARDLLAFIPLEFFVSSDVYKILHEIANMTQPLGIKYTVEELEIVADMLINDENFFYL